MYVLNFYPYKMYLSITTVRKKSMKGCLCCFIDKQRIALSLMSSPYVALQLPYMSGRGLSQPLAGHMLNVTTCVPIT